MAQVIPKCKNGHDLDEKNRKINSVGFVICRACRQLSQRRSVLHNKNKIDPSKLAVRRGLVKTT